MARTLLLVACMCLMSVAYGAKKNWNKVDWEKAEKELEQGDDEELLQSEDEIAAKEYERRKNQKFAPPDPSVKLK
jgi:hypothetical protein